MVVKEERVSYTISICRRQEYVQWWKKFPEASFVLAAVWGKT